VTIHIWFLIGAAGSLGAGVSKLMYPERGQENPGNASRRKGSTIFPKTLRQLLEGKIFPRFNRPPLQRLPCRSQFGPAHTGRSLSSGEHICKLPDPSHAAKTCG
jgi:hypothetical protein